MLYHLMMFEYYRFIVQVFVHIKNKFTVHANIVGLSMSWKPAHR